MVLKKPWMDFFNTMIDGHHENLFGDTIHRYVLRACPPPFHPLKKRKMKKFALILRIISYITTAPALILFFYFVLHAVGSETTGLSSVILFAKAIGILITPMVLNIFSRHLDGTLYNR
jgi:hypothetical protein